MPAPTSWCTRHGVALAIEVKQRALVRDGDIPALTRGFTASDRREGAVRAAAIVVPNG